jgi:hypothetical protein
VGVFISETEDWWVKDFCYLVYRNTVTDSANLCCKIHLHGGRLWLVQLLVFLRIATWEVCFCFLIIIFKCWLPLWSSGQSSWLQIQRFGFDSWRYHIFWEEVGLERGPLSFVSAIEELLGRNSSGSILENRDYVHRDPSCWPPDTHYPWKLVLTSLTSGSHSVGIVCPRTKTTELCYYTKVVRKIRFPMIFHNEKHVYWHWIIHCWKA